MAAGVWGSPQKCVCGYPNAMLALQFALSTKVPDGQFIAIFKNKANSRRNGTSLSSQKAKLSEKHIVSRSEGHPASSP